MIKGIRSTVAALALGVLVLGSLPAFGQYREYYFFGTVVDTDKKPLADVEIFLRDTATSRSFTVKTKADGTFRFAGLPHGVYKVTFSKEGYAAKEDEWRFASPRERMEKVEIPTVTLVTQELVTKSQQLKAMEAEIKAAAEKLRDKDFAGAVGQLKAFLEKHPDDANALYYIGIGYARLNMKDEAAAALTRVTVLAPAFAPAHFELGVCLQAQDKSDQALEHYRKCFELDPTHADSAYNAGLVLFGPLAQPDEAKAFFEKARALRPNDADILDMLGRCAIHAGDYPAAVDLLEKAKAVTTDADKLKYFDDLIAKLREMIKKEIPLT